MEKETNLNPFDNRELKYLELVFENCEVYKIPADCVHFLSIGNINYYFNVHINGLDKYTKLGEISSWARTDCIDLVLNKKGMFIKSDWVSMLESFEEDNDFILKNRIEHRDVTQVEFHFSDNTYLNVLVPWEDDVDEYHNKYQKNYIKDDMINVMISNDENDYNDDELESYYKHYTFSQEYDNNIEKTILEDCDISIPNYVRAALIMIDDELCRVMWNRYQKEYDSPFNNTGNKFLNDVFDVEAYDWDNEDNQEYNFKYKDYKIKWYKHFTRDPRSNREMSPDECSKMLDEILESLKQMDIDEEDIFDE